MAGKGKKADLITDQVPRKSSSGCPVAASVDIDFEMDLAASDTSL